MSNVTRFILSGDLQTETVIEKNVQTSLLFPFVDLAQPLYIKRVLGLALYDDLTNQIIAVSGLTNVTALTQSYQDLIREIKTPLCYCTWYEAFPFLHWKLTNKGITLKSSIENDTTPAKMEDVEKLRSQVYNWASFYLEEFKQFLRNNRQSYPLWREDVFYQKDFQSGSTTTSTSYFNGIQFDNAIYYGPINKNDPRHFYNGDDFK